MGQKMYEVLKNDNDIDVQNEWFRECTEKSIPYIYIVKKTKYSVIHWDYISINPDLDEAVFDNPSLEAYLHGVFQTVANEKSVGEYSTVVGWFKDISNEYSEIAAKAIFFGLNQEIEEYKKKLEKERLNLRQA